MEKKLIKTLKTIKGKRDKIIAIIKTKKIDKIIFLY